jgi:hypothetical protein
MFYTGYCWIAQSGLQSNLVACIVIDNTKSYFDIGLILWSRNKAKLYQH